VIENLPEDFLYERLPEGLVELDARGLIQAVVGGYQDRIEDLRSYSRKMELLFQTSGLPETGNNVVLVDVQSDQGKVYTRSLDIQSDTPADGTAALTTWVLRQLEIGEDTISNVRYGRDLLRLVDANTIDYLAATIGAILFKSSALTVDEQLTANHQLLQTYFPRLKIKGTADSFMALGRILGFDDVKVTPLYGRLSPRIPNDIGNPANDADFSAEPEYQPQQTIDDFYNPLKTDDGPFFSWSGTVSPGTAATNFCTQVVNDKNPWVDVSILRVTNGTVTYPSAGSYALGSSGSNSEGGPHKKAYVEAGDILFRALGEGQYFNGIEIHVVDSGTNKIFTVTDRLSAIKYRSSYFDLALTAEFDRVEELYGRSAMRRNKDLAANPTLTADGTALSPYRPWWAGSVTTGSLVRDFLVMTGTQSPTVITARVQSTGTDRQLNVDELVSAGVQVVQAMDEVRAATRQARKAGIGFLNRDDVGYAAYTKETRLITTDLFGTNIVSATYLGPFGTEHGLDAYSPLPPYYALIALQLGTDAPRTYPEAVADPSNPNTFLFSAPSFYASLDFASAAYEITFTPPRNGTSVYLLWHPTSTEVVRVEPGNGTEKAYEARPEDQDDGTHTYEVADDFPWRRDLALGGEVVDLAIYNPITPDVSVADVDPVMAVPGHDGADYDVFGINSPSGHLRLVTSPRSIGSDYRQGMSAVAYSGALKDLASVTSTPGQTELERLFEPGAKLYMVGNVQGVLVADPNKFYSGAHRTALIGWFPFNEHLDADLAPLDHSVCAANFTPVSLDAASRLWDTNRGWFLNANLGATLTSRKLRFIGVEFSLSFWIKPGASTNTGDLLTYGPLRIQWNGATTTLTFFNGATTIGSLAIGVGFKFVSLTINATSAVIGAGDLSTAISASTYAGSYTGFSELDDVLTIFGLGVGLSDLRMWSSIKTTDQLNTIRYYNPTDTQVGYQVGSFLSLNRRDRYALKVLACGLVEAGPLPAWYTVPRLGAAVRYNSLGLYEGESRFKEVGLGGGQIPPSHYPLGQQFYELTATGQLVVGNQTGVEPGYTSAWGSYVWSYLKVIQTASESYDLYANTGTLTPWPNPMEATNATNDAVWVKGDDGFMYQVSLESQGTGARLVAELVARDRTQDELKISSFGPNYWGTNALGISEQPTGPQTILAQRKSRLHVSVNGTEVFQKPEPEATAAEVQAAFNYSNFLNWNVPPGYEIDLIGNGFFDFFPSEGLYVDMVGTPLLGRLESKRQFVLESSGSYKLSMKIAGNQRVSGSVFTIAAGVWPDITTYNISGQFDPLVSYEKYFSYGTQHTGTISIEQTQGYSVGGTGIGNILTYVKFENVASGVVLLEDDFDSEIKHFLSTPPLFLYLNSKTVLDAANAFDYWADQNDFGANLTPPTAALNANGELVFESQGVIVPGNYRLIVVSGNIGKADSDFDGFAVEIAVDATILQKRLCAGLGGYNFTGTDTFDFAIENGVSGDFLISFKWTNAFSDPARGEARQLAIRSFKLERLVTEQYVVEVNGTGSIPSVILQDTGTYNGTVSGGWIAAMNSYGSVAAWQHESAIYPGSDTLTSKMPLSEMLTATTIERREDILAPTNIVLIDATPGTIPSFGTIAES
jgi:hypothetical protein